MCGLAGFVDFNCNTKSETLTSMTDCITHRGPDDSGHEYVQANDFTLGLGFRRLSIIELTALGHQPMNTDDGNYTLIFNGEIYNYKEVRKVLQDAGIRFKSNSDSEVILQSYIKWGRECVQRFIGMFAFVIYDKPKQQLLACRDRAGVKPFLYYWNENLFLFGSELKSFHQHHQFKKQISNDALALYFQHGYIPAPHCVFQNAYKLTPGHWLIVDLKKKEIKTEKYWDVTNAYNQQKLKIDYVDAVTETEKLLRSAFEYRMVADVPVGVFLSGGYDSSLVTALLQTNRQQKLKTFTIGFEEEAFNEATWARKVATHLGTEHHEFTCTYKQAMEIIPTLADMYDEPFADSSAIPTYLVSKVARQQVTVALSADGGDETFAGYTKYDKALRYINKLNTVPSFGKSVASLPLHIANQFAGDNLSTPDRIEKLKLILKAKHPVEAFNIITQGMTVSEVHQLLAKDFKIPPTAFEDYNELHASELLDNFLWLDYKTYMADDILQKVDRASMAVSLEGREPLIDHRIIEWAAQLPSDFKLKNGTSKLILRDITHKYLPREIMERPKMGFNIPYESWFKNDLKKELIETLDEKNIQSGGFLNPKEVSVMLDSFFANAKVDFQRIWQIYNFQLWFNRWMC
ncbi:MAG: asparagine synthase (glutamine-hydrolyzing) [Bacteroidia bacterium]